MVVKSKKTAVIFAVCAIAAVAFFLFCLIFALNVGDGEGENQTQNVDTGMHFTSMHVDVKCIPVSTF